MLNENLLTSSHILRYIIINKHPTLNVFHSHTSFKSIKTFLFRSYFHEIYLEIKFIPRIFDCIICHSQYFFFFTLLFLRHKFTESEIHVVDIFGIHQLLHSDAAVHTVHKNGTRIYCLQINIYFCTRCI